MSIENLVIRCDAGLKYGLGHLSRCITLAETFTFSTITFIIRTDSLKLVHDFIKTSTINKHNPKIFCLDLEISQQDELNRIDLELNTVDSFLILDHYEINDDYQKFLKSKKYKWLQFDSHAKIDLYANYILHGSSAATKSMYQPLVKSSDSKLLVGADYAIIKPEVRELRASAVIRKQLNQIIICFGGGSDNGATLKVLKFLDPVTLNDITLKVSVKGSNTYIKSINQVSNKFKDFEFIKPNDLAYTMLTSDLAIIAPGMISYEAACLGLPMLLVTTADNQQINAKGWKKHGCSRLLGSLEELNKLNINTEISFLHKNPDYLSDISENCLKCIDGHGVFRVKDTILGDT